MFHWSKGNPHRRWLGAKEPGVSRFHTIRRSTFVASSAGLFLLPASGQLPPNITKSFGAAAIAVGGSTSLTFTVTSPDVTGMLTGVAFTDTLPAGLVVSTPSVITATCSGTITATAGASSVSLAGLTIVGAGPPCTFVVNVTATTAGVKNNS